MTFGLHLTVNWHHILSPSLIPALWHLSSAVSVDNMTRRSTVVRWACLRWSRELRSRSGRLTVPPLRTAAGTASREHPCTTWAWTTSRRTWWDLRCSGLTCQELSCQWLALNSLEPQLLLAVSGIPDHGAQWQRWWVAGAHPPAQRFVLPSRSAVCWTLPCPPSFVAPSRHVTDESSNNQRSTLEATLWFALFRFLCNDAQHGGLAPGIVGLGRLVLSDRLSRSKYHSAHRRGATRSLYHERCCPQLAMQRHGGSVHADSQQTCDQVSSWFNNNDAPSKVHAALKTWMMVCLLSWRGAGHKGHATVIMKCPVRCSPAPKLPEHALYSVSEGEIVVNTTYYPMFLSFFIGELWMQFVTSSCTIRACLCPHLDSLSTFKIMWSAVIKFCSNPAHALLRFYPTPGSCCVLSSHRLLNNFHHDTSSFRSRGRCIVFFQSIHERFWQIQHCVLHFFFSLEVSFGSRRSNGWYNFCVW